MIAARWSSAIEVASHNILPISVDLPSSTEPQVSSRTMAPLEAAGAGEGNGAMISSLSVSDKHQK